MIQVGQQEDVTGVRGSCSTGRRRNRWSGTAARTTLSRGKHAKHVVVVMQSQSELFEVVTALSSASRFASLLHGRKQQGDQNGDDYQQFDQRETARSASIHVNTLLQKT
jgi:hypothetical protein